MGRQGQTDRGHRQDTQASTTPAQHSRAKDRPPSAALSINANANPVNEILQEKGVNYRLNRNENLANKREMCIFLVS